MLHNTTFEINLTPYLDRYFKRRGLSPFIADITSDHTFNELHAELYMPLPENVIYHDPATIVFWDDETKTVVKCQPGDQFDPEKGLMAAMLKRYLGNDNTFNKVINRWVRGFEREKLALPSQSEGGNE